MLSFERLKELLDYDAQTGIFVWKRSIGAVKRGSVAGTITNKGYRAITIDSKKYQAHNLAWYYVKEKWPEGEIDHVKHVKDDNRFTELREANREEQTHNLPARNNQSTPLGVKVTPHGTWNAYLIHNQTTVLNATFDTFEEAVSARKKAEHEFGFHPNHGT